jgi:hypothetical protein
VNALRQRGSGLDWVDGLLALGVGILGALIAVALPPIVAVGLVGSLGAVAMLTRFERIEQIARMLMFLSALTIPMNNLFIGSTGVPFGDVIITAALGLYLLVRLAERREAGDNTWRWVFGALGVLALGGFVGALFETGGPFIYTALGVAPRDVSGWGQNLGNLMKFLLGSLIPIGLWALARPSRAYLRQILGWFVAGCTISALVAFTLPMGRGGSRYIGLTVHPNQFGSLSLLAMGPALGLMLRSKRMPAWGFAVFPILAFGIVQSGSRAALGGMFVFALLAGGLTRNRTVLGVLMAGAAAALILFASGVVQPQGENALGRAFGDSATAQGSDSVRDSLHHNVWHRFVLRPITGNGYNYMKPSHNVYLGLIASAGVLGVIGMGMVIGAAIRRTWRKRADLLAVGVSAGYFAYLGNAFFDNIFWWRWLWFYVGMVFATLATEPNNREMGLPDEEVDEEPEAVIEPVPARIGPPRFVP